MNRMMRMACLALALAGFGCGNVDIGGGGDGDDLVFAEGYVFAREGELYVADKHDFTVEKRIVGSGSASEPALSADGRTVVYVHNELSGASSLRKISSGGSGDTELVPAQPGRRVGQPAVSSDGSTIAFVATRSSGTLGTVHIVNSDGSNERALGHSLYDASPTFYPNDQALLVLTGTNPSALSLMGLARLSLSGTRSGIPFARTGELGKRAAISPDGTKIAFEMLDDDRQRIYVRKEGGDIAPLSESGGTEQSPTWVAADRVGFASDAGGGWNVYETEVSSRNDVGLKVAGAQQCASGGYGATLVSSLTP